MSPGRYRMRDIIFTGSQRFPHCPSSLDSYSLHQFQGTDIHRFGLPIMFVCAHAQMVGDAVRVYKRSNSNSTSGFAQASVSIALVAVRKGASG